MHFKRFMSIVLVLLMSIQAVQLSVFVNAAEINSIINGDYEYVIEDAEIIDDEESLSDSEIIDDEFISPSDFEFIFEDQSSQNMTASDGIIYESAADEISHILDIDNANALQMISNYGSEDAALYEARLFGTLSGIYYTLSYDEAWSGLVSLVVSGLGAERVAYSYIVSDILSADHPEIMALEYPAVIEDETIEYLVNCYHISYDFVTEYLTEKQISSDVLLRIIQNTIEVMFPSALTNTLDDGEEDTSTYPAAPFYSQSGQNEYVSPVSGNLTYVLNLGEVPGMNGMDIDLTLEYNSLDSGLTGKMSGTGGGAPVKDSNGNVVGAYTYTETFYEPYDWSNKSPLIFGNGWHLDYDYIDMSTGSMYLTLTDGSRYWVTKPTVDSLHVAGYNSKQFTFVYANDEYLNAEYKLTFVDGTVEYFDESGNILAKLDRFGNSITFTYSDISIPVDIEGSTDVYTKRMVITNAGGSVTVDYSLLNERITLPDGGIIRFAYTRVGEGYQLVSYTDQEGKVTSFSYMTQECGNKNYSINSTQGGIPVSDSYIFERPIHHFLTSITYPTGSSATYAYVTNESSRTTKAAVASRQDNIGTTIKNSISYTYDSLWVGSAYAIRLSVADYGIKQVRYSYNGNFVSKEETLVDDSIKNWVSRTYNSYGGKVTSETFAYSLSDDGSTYISYTDTYAYDDYGYMTSSTVNGFTKTYTYTGNYHLLSTVSYTTPAGSSVLEANGYWYYTLLPDETYVYVDNVLREKNGYTYDSYGNVLTDKKYTSSNSNISTTYSYDNKGRLLSQTTAGITNSYTYDLMGRVLSETDGNGNVTSYTYDIMGRTLQVTNPDHSELSPSKISYVYTVANGVNRVSMTDEAGIVTVYNYDGLGNISSVTKNNTLTKSYEYDAYSRVAKEMDSSGNYTVYSYDYSDRITSLNVYSPTATTSEYCETYAYSVVQAGSLLKTSKTVLGDTNAPSITTVSYTNLYGQTVKDGYVNSSNSEVLSYYSYDTMGNKTQDLSPNDCANGFSYSTKYTYDYAGRLLSQENALGQTSYVNYDWLGNAISKIDVAGNISTYNYDAFGRVLTQTTPFDELRSTRITYTYDGNGNTVSKITEEVTSESASLLNKTVYVYDSRNNLAEVRSYTSDSAYIVTASYTYDKMCRMLTSTSCTYTTSYTYDAYGNVSRITYPGGGYETFVYNPDGLLISSTDRNGVTKSYVYNALGNPLSITAGTSTITYTYTATGAVRTESNGVNTINYTYDAAGRMASEYVGNVATAYVYDLNGNVVTMVMSSRSVTYAYDRLNRLATVSEGNTQTTYTYNTLGGRSQTTTRLNGALVTTTAYAYNIAGLPTAVANYGSDNLIVSSFSYTYRGDGNIASERDYNNVTTTYTYDLLGRLVSEVGGCSRYYSYDVSGNRTQAIVDTATTISYTYDSDGRLVSEISNNGSSLLTTSYAYDSNGSLISENDGDATTYTYDVWGNMTSAGNASYAYNAQGLRISKTVNGSTDNFVLVGGDVWSDSENTYLRGLELISSDDYFYLYNIRGDVIQLLNYSGEVVKTYDYDAYGNELSRDLADENPFRYCGEYYDTETGFVYLRARYYDPSVGRFTSKDIHWNPYNSIYGDNPVKTQNSDDCTSYYPDDFAIRQSSNSYAYCGNNPITFNDANGQFFMLATAAVGALIGGIAGAIFSYATVGEIDWKSVAIGAIAGGVVGLGAGALTAFFATGSALATTTEVLIYGTKWAATLATSGATTSAALGRAFEEWFYKAYNITKTAQQVVIEGVGRVDAVVNGYIYELKNYSWDKYSLSQLGSIASRFVEQANRYLSADRVRGLIYYFSNEPPKQIKDALEAAGAVVKWVSSIR